MAKGETIFEVNQPVIGSISSNEAGYLNLDLVRYPLGREGVFTPGGCVCLPHAMGIVIYIVGLAVLWT